MNLGLGDLPGSSGKGQPCRVLVRMGWIRPLGMLRGWVSSGRSLPWGGPRSGIGVGGQHLIPPAVGRGVILSPVGLGGSFPRLPLPTWGALSIAIDSPVPGREKKCQAWASGFCVFFCAFRAGKSVWWWGMEGSLLQLGQSCKAPSISGPGPPSLLLPPRLQMGAEPSATTPPRCPPPPASASGSCGSRPLRPPTLPPPSASSQSAGPTSSQ